MDHTNRENIAHQTRSPLCQACHSIINPTGFAFENFDSFGRIRSQEIIFDKTMQPYDSYPVSTGGQVSMDSQNSVSVSDAYDLITNVATSPKGAACFTKNIFRSIYEKQENSGDGCQLTDTYKKVFDSQQSITEALVTLLANDSIFYKYEGN